MMKELRFAIKEGNLKSGKGLDGKLADEGYLVICASHHALLQLLHRVTVDLGVCTQPSQDVADNLRVHRVTHQQYT